MMLFQMKIVVWFYTKGGLLKKVAVLYSVELTGERGGFVLCRDHLASRWNTIGKSVCIDLVGMTVFQRS